MKNLIINGSPHRNGDTSYIVHKIAEQLPGQIDVVDVYQKNIRPCIDCRFCGRNEGCAIKDDMTEIYEQIREADHILIASPIYFGELNGALLSMFSRLQTYYSSRYIRLVEPIGRRRTGGIVLTAGSTGPFDHAIRVAEMFLRIMWTDSQKTICVQGTDEKRACDQEAVQTEIEELVKLLKES